MAHETALRPEKAQILRTTEERDLERITEADVQAVIYTPRAMPPWLPQLARAVEDGSFQIPRVVLSTLSCDEISNWLEINLPALPLPEEVREALKKDILRMVERLGKLSNASGFLLRLFTEVPSTNCGFHVDTVPPRAAVWGFLRVYNGAGTEYVHPENVIGMTEFYKYLSRRERLERERGCARQNGDMENWKRLEFEISLLDRERPFLKKSAEVHVIPAGSIVAFKHLDVSLHWSDHDKALAWIHCSPMQGESRLVVNVTTLQMTAYPSRRATRVMSQ